MLPVYVDVKPPAKRPYIRPKMQSSGKEVDAMPHKTNAEIVVPTAEIMTAVVTCHLSVTAPRMIWPKTDAMLRSASGIAVLEDSVPSIDRAYVGR